MEKRKPDEKITKAISYIKDGLFAVYYCNDQEVAVELYSQNGTIIYRSGRIPDGIAEELYKNGVLKRSVPFKDGNEHGLCTEYYPSGDVFEENSYRRGILHGPSKTYRQDKTVWMEALYKNGKLHGPFRSYHDNGSIDTKAEYSHGKLHGPYVTYDKHGLVVEEGRYERGKKKGTYLTYHDNGHPSRIEIYKQGVLVSCEDFNEDEEAILTMRTGQKTGPEAEKG